MMVYFDASYLVNENFSISRIKATQRGGKDASMLLVVIKCVHWTTLDQNYSKVGTAQR